MPGLLPVPHLTPPCMAPCSRATHLPVQLACLQSRRPPSHPKVPTHPPAGAHPLWLLAVLAGVRHGCVAAARLRRRKLLCHLCRRRRILLSQHLQGSLGRCRSNLGAHHRGQERHLGGLGPGGEGMCGARGAVGRCAMRSFHRTANTAAQPCHSSPGPCPYLCNHWVGRVPKRQHLLQGQPTTAAS